MVLIWLLVGIIAVSIAFFLPGASLDPWVSLRPAEIVSAVFLIALVAYTTRKPFPLKQRIFSWVLVAILLVGGTVFSNDSHQRTSWQKNQLIKILGVIQHGILMNEMPGPLLASLKKYHQQPQRNRKPIGEVFKEMKPGVKVGDNIYVAAGEGDSLAIYVASLTKDEVVLVGQPAWGKGRSPDFTNFNGRKGLVQVRATLTQKGVTYESEN